MQNVLDQMIYRFYRGVYWKGLCNISCSFYPARRHFLLHLISREPDFEKSLRALKQIEKQKTGPHHQQPR
jgi:hypothetical protein